MNNSQLYAYHCDLFSSTEVSEWTQTPQSFFKAWPTECDNKDVATLCYDWADVPENCSARGDPDDEDEDEDEDRSSGANYKILDQYLDPKKKQENDKQIGKLKSQIKDQFRKANLTASFKKVFEVFALSVSLPSTLNMYCPFLTISGIVVLKTTMLRHSEYNLNI